MTPVFPNHECKCYTCYPGDDYKVYTCNDDQSINNQHVLTYWKSKMATHVKVKYFVV